MNKLDDLHVGQFYRFYHNLHAYSTPPPEFCTCGSRFVPDHHQCCPQLKREELTKERHDPIEEVTAICCSEAGIRVERQKRVSNANRLLPDLRLTFHDVRKNQNPVCLADVVVTHTSAPSYIHKDALSVLISKEKEKHTTYNAAYVRSTYGPHAALCSIYGLSISSYGVFSPEFLALIQRASHPSRLQGKMHFDIYPSQLSYRMIDRILVALHRGNAMAQMAGWQRASSLRAQACTAVEPMCN